MFALSAFAALTPLLANFAQIGASPVGRILFGALFAALAEAGLWGVVYFVTGLALDSLSGRPPSLASARGNFSGGATRGAIYGGVFMLLILGVSSPLRVGGVVAFTLAHARIIAPIAGAIAFPLAQTLIGSADGTAPFIGRLRAAYGDSRAWARGIVIGGGCWWAYVGDLVHADPLSRFCWAFVIGAFAYAGIDALFDLALIVDGKRRRMQSARVYWLGALLGGFVAGALGWYFDAAQVAVVWNKFWAYSDANYRLTGRALGDFVTYPIFNKYGMVNLGEVAGGVRLLYAESLSGVINWSFAAPLFAINAVFLTAILDRSLRPIRGLFSGAGAQGLVELAVRVMRWGLWMAPIINTFLRQSADPSWYNQDGAVRSLVAIGADVGMPHDGFADFSLTMFLGLLAYDWLRVLIWFDHMGLRVATLVNLSFLGGDRLDEAAARFIGHGARTRAIPDGIRRFGTWAPLLIPFYIPRGAAWDKAWTGAEALSHGGATPGAVKTLAVAYGVAGVAAGATALALALRSREAAGTGTPVPPLPGAPAALVGRPQAFAGHNGSVGVELMRDGRGAAYVAGDERGGFAIDLFRRPLDPLQQRGHFFYLCEDGDAPWSIGWAPARRAGDYEVERIGFNRFRISNTVNGLRATMERRPRPARARSLNWRIRLENHAGRARALRLVSFCEIAGHEVGAYARDLDFAGMHVETMFVRALNAIFARNRLLRSARADRGETSFFAVKPGAGCRLTGYEDSRTRFLGEGSLAKPTGCERWRARKTDDEGKLWTFDPAASFTLEVELAAHGVGGGRIHHRPLRQRGVGGRARRRTSRPAADRRSRPRGAILRDARGRAVAGAARPLAFRLFARRPVAAPHPSHAAAVGAGDGQRTRRFDGREQRRRSLFGDGQRASQRPDAVPLRERDDDAARPDRLCPRHRRRRDRRDRLRAVPARGRRIRGDLRTRRRAFRQAARRSGDGLRRLRPDRLSRRHAARHAAQSRPSPSAACASRRSSTSRSTKAPTKASAS